MTSFSLPAGWPQPDPLAEQISRQLLDRLHGEIQDGGGSIPFSQYMDRVLNEPGLGYYSAGARKFGPDGDFVTAPEITPLFAKCVATSVVSLTAGMAHPELLEVGAGSGVMAAGLLATLRDRGRLPDRYLILERSADLRARQQQIIREQVPDVFERVTWLDRLPAVGFEGVILGNEVLDALPVERFVVRDGTVHRIDVGIENGDLHEIETRLNAQEADQWMPGLPAAVIGANDYRSEFCPTLRPWISSLADLLTRGAMLWVDYGYARSEYYHPQRSEGTLVCHYRHRVHDDPYLLPGLQDITAHVDFTAVAEAGHAVGLEVAGFVTQAAFLADTGIDSLLHDMSGNEPAEMMRLAGQVRQLMLPGEMGERFRCMLLTRNLAGVHAGFRQQDLRGRL